MEEQNAMAVRNSVDIIRNVDDLIRLGTILLKSGLLPVSIKTPEAAAAIILKGHELNIGAMEALSSINVIQGKPTTSPQLMLALARRTKELENISIEDDGNACTVVIKRKGQSPITTTFSMEDAKRMNLSNKDNWIKQAPTMRQWRALGANLRLTFGDAIAGLYTYEKMGAEVEVDGEGAMKLTALPEKSIEATYEVQSEPTPTKSESRSEVISKKIDQLTKSQPSPASETERATAKRAVVKTGLWQAALKEIGTLPYYQKNGGIDTWHILASAAKLGYTEITDTNVNEVKLMLKEHARAAMESVKVKVEAEPAASPA